MNVDNIADVYELSPLQQGMVFHSLQAPQSGLYLEQISVSLNGGLNAGAFAQSWQQLVDNHSALRTSVHWDDFAKPLQVVHRYAKLPIEHLDWREVAHRDWKSRFEAYLIADRTRGITLTEAPLIRLTLIQLTFDLHHFLMTFHHVLLDGWSLQLILKDFALLYDAACRGQAITLEPVRPYGDYIAWLQQQDLSQAEDFWRRTLRGMIAPTPFRVDRPPTANTEEERYNEKGIRLSEAATEALQSVARRYQLTFNTLTQFAWAVLLSRYSGEEDVMFGTIVSGRPAALLGVENMVGMFINTLPVRLKVPPQESLLSVLQRLQADQFEARLYEYSPLMSVQGWSEIPRGTPLYESILVFENYPTGSPAKKAGNSGRKDGDAFGDESDAELSFGCVERTNVPITVTITPGDRLSIKILYDCRRLDTATITRMLGHLAILLEAMTGDPDQPVADLPLLTDAERRRLLFDWNATKQSVDYSEQPTLFHRFEEQAELHPDAPAFTYEASRLSYHELNCRANQLANHLRKLGVNPGVRVGLFLERSLDVPVALLGTIKAGGVYVPLDPTYPEERLAFMVADADVSVIVTKERFLTMAPVRQHPLTVCLDADSEVIAACPTGSTPATAVKAEDLAYIIYTSGSTGNPKGVAVEHRQIYNRLAWMWEAYPFAEGEVSCQKTALNFVDSLWELLGPLLKGVSTVIISDDVLRDMASLVQALADGRVTRIWLVPSLLRALLDAYPNDLQHRLPHLRFWVTSGETLSPSLFRDFWTCLPTSKLYNLYGTSEVWDATWYSAQPDDATAVFDRIPIGRPIANVQAYVLHSDRQPAPIGVPGELYVGGDGLARGYVKRPELDAAHFIPNPFQPESSARLYRTGDMARWRDDGNLEFLGRTDRQVKVRGYRIELGELEALLEQHPAVGTAAVMAREDIPGDKRLVAYVTMAQQQDFASRTLLVQDLRRHLQLYLPLPMLPTAWTVLSALPLLPNGKVNRLGLPAPEKIMEETEAVETAPRNEIEQGISSLFSTVLGVSKFSIHDNFFTELGGHSLLATQLISRVRNTFGVEVPLQRLFEAPSVAQFSLEIENLLLTEIESLPEAAAESMPITPQIERRTSA